ncbi:MAG: hypothetical protein ABFR50_09960 [Candidatus Fermentibacteria bacterium]
MTNSQIESDIGYVKDLVAKSDRSNSPASFYFIWGVILMAGFSLNDFAPGLVGLFWMIAGLGGGLLTAFLGYRAEVNKGQMDPQPRN